MFQEKIPPEKYNQLADRFSASKFDAGKLAHCAVRAGAKYIVLTSRHHDGFCLWDSKITPFNSANSKARRDLIAEYVSACRSAGLRVGIYYSIMSWQHVALHKGPYADPEGWEAMVQETHGQLRELMSGYGQIDLLWYDGGFVPGLGDAESIAKYWRSKQLNAMIRDLQPNILINDRSGTPEDFNTPEQHIVPAPHGRRWEACMTVNDHWGYCKTDHNYKSVPTLINMLTTCARFGGNLLLNIGPRGDGSIPKEAIKQLDGLGAWMTSNGQSIYGSQRTEISESNLGNYSATTRDKKLFLHLPPETSHPLRFGLRGCQLKTDRYLTESDGNTYLLDYPENKPVIEIDCEKSASTITPAKVLLDQSHAAGESNAGIVFGAGKYDPEPAAILNAKTIVRHSKNQNEVNLVLPVSVSGKYRLEIGVIGSDIGPMTIELNHGEYKNRICHANIPDTLEINDLVLPQGLLPLQLRASRGKLSVYALRLQPTWRPIDSTCWQTVGPFQTGFGAHQPISEVRKAMMRIDPPQKNNSKLAMKDALGRSVDWTRAIKCLGEHSEEGVNFPYRVARDYIGVCFARTHIISPDDREAEVQIGTDWWANAWINESPIMSDRAIAEIRKDGAQFNAWRPKPGKMKLKKGSNTLLVKCHPGTAACWFTCWISDPGDLKISSDFSKIK